MKIAVWQIAINEAQKARGLVGHNPAVGAVVVRGNTIIAQGHTHAPGKNHAEIEALKKAGTQARGASLYVTLEPCSHLRKQTGPCTDAIINAGIKKVVVASKDPNPLVNGEGIKKLKKAGIIVELLLAKSVIAQQARVLNQPFFKAMQTGLPFVTLKAGITLDGKIATKTGDSKWITSVQSRIDARLERSLCDAVVVGVGTVMADNPELAPHGRFKNKSLLRVIIDPELSLNKKYQIFRNENVLVICTAKASRARQDYFKKNKINFIECGKKIVEWSVLLKFLGEQKIRSVFVEGGAGVHGSLVDAARVNPKLLDRVILYVSPKIFGGQALSVIGGAGVSAAGDAFMLPGLQVEKITSDFKFSSVINEY
ncbi:MAG: bifunctional diaminohydroxyphosphoribosylaminopyrimidine deaminase/5-amino-6-(5-phosphoribosylamino)uracil reductase RibD [Candidatus Magasanikbacteria bacterium]|nr:bifunctional diaminohydroxyphosphoribosylaminopyrimidine deaminase/5-amino-6-(5-phosphoribosylamino)uracil reductase RibD [Candidatus Magasanikbacteria bacterium]